MFGCNSHSHAHPEITFANLWDSLVQSALFLSFGTFVGAHGLLLPKGKPGVVLAGTYEEDITLSGHVVSELAPKWLLL